MEESLGLGKKSSGAETDTETWSWFRLPIPKPGFGCTLVLRSLNEKVAWFTMTALELSSYEYKTIIALIFLC